MKKVFLVILLFTGLTSFTPVAHQPASATKSEFTMNLCTNGYNKEVQSGEIYMNGTLAGYVIALSRASKHVKAKYFAYKQNGTIVHDRYDQWRSGKNIVLISSGAYANGFQASDTPIGLTVDNGNKVNDQYDPTMDALVIVEEVGGIRISDIEAGDLKLKINNTDKPIDIKNGIQKVEFLRWCESEKATVFQSHLLIYKNQLKFNRPDSKQAVRKMLVLVQDKSGNVFHLILYAKFMSLSLYDMATYTLNMLTQYGLYVVAGVNLDTGSLDVLNTSTDLYDCSFNPIEGINNKERRSVSNMLAYYYE